MKTCSKCKIPKALDEFHARSDGGSKDGKVSQCKSCIYERQSVYRSNNKNKLNKIHREYHAANREKENKRNAEYCRKNRELLKVKNKEWVNANQERVRENQSRWFSENRDRVRENKRIWREANRDRLKISDKEYRDKKYAENREKEIARASASNHRRRVSLKNHSYESMTLQEMIDLKFSVTKCLICGNNFDLIFHKKSYEHIVPVHMGGSNGPLNLGITGLRCNLSRPKDGRDIKKLQNLRLVQLEIQNLIGILESVKGK